MASSSVGTRRALHCRPDYGPVCALCGKLPTSPESERRAIEFGTSDDFDVYTVTIDRLGGPRYGSALWIAWVCAGRVHGNLADSSAEGRRIGWRTR